MRTFRIPLLLLVASVSVASVSVISALSAQDAEHRTWAERLGYPAGKRVIILHADDVGMCAEANLSTERYLEAGQIQSAAVMMTCPWADEFVAWARKRPKLDVGLHLTLTSEWKYYRWGPVSPRKKVPGLVDQDGYLWRNVLMVATNATAEEVEREVRAQVERALSRGLKPGHLDTHMGTLYARLDFTKAYLEVAVEYDIPAMVIELTPPIVKRFREQGYPITKESIRLAKDYPLPKLDDFHAVPDGETYEELRENFQKLVRSLSPGITEIIFHPSDESPALRRITGSWRQRSMEAKLFADPEIKKFFESEGVVFTDWREMMRRFRERNPKAADSAPDEPPKAKKS